MTVHNPEDYWAQASAAAPLASLGDEPVLQQHDDDTGAGSEARWLLAHSEFTEPEALAMRAEVSWAQAAAVVAAAFDDDDEDDDDFMLTGSTTTPINYESAAAAPTGPSDRVDDAALADAAAAAASKAGDRRCELLPLALTQFDGGLRFAVFDTEQRYLAFWSRSDEVIASFVAEPVRPGSPVRDLQVWWEVLANLAVVIEDVAGVPAGRIVPESRFVDDLHMDSINAIEVDVHIKELYDIDVPTDVLPRLRTVGEAVDYITAQYTRPTVTPPPALPPSSATATGPAQRRQTL